MRRSLVLFFLLLAACPKQTTTREDAAVASANALPPPKQVAPPPVVDAAPPDPAQMAERGKLAYARYCNFCHADDGKGYKADNAPALADDDLLALASDDFLKAAIQKGRPGTSMSAWSVMRGGPLGDPQAEDLVAFLRTWQKRPSETLPAGQEGGTGSATRGAVVYAAQCATCHGAKGVDGKYNEVANPELLASASDAFLTTTITRGRANTPMPAFEKKLTPEQIADVVALLRSWQKPPEEVPELPPKPGALEHVVINPGGPQPTTFDEKADFIAAEIVKKELDKKSSMVIVDARPPADYARMHIPGAISVPFYDVEKYAPQIPKDKWILNYCACPHGSSVHGRDAFRKAGYKKVSVIDEGILAWRERGYGVRGGAKP